LHEKKGLLSVSVGVDHSKRSGEWPKEGERVVPQEQEGHGMDLDPRKKKNHQSIHKKRLCTKKEIKGGGKTHPTDQQGSGGGQRSPIGGKKGRNRSRKPYLERNNTNESEKIMRGRKKKKSGIGFVKAQPKNNTQGDANLAREEKERGVDQPLPMKETG